MRDFLYRELVYKIIIDNVINESDTELDKLLDIQEWVHKNEFPISSFGLIDGPALADFVRGIGYCDMLSQGVMSLANKIGIDGRVTGLYGYDSISHHSIAELKIDGEFRIFEPTYNVVFVSSDNELSTFNDMHNKDVIKISHGNKYNEKAISYNQYLGDDFYRFFEKTYPPRILATSYSRNNKDLISKLKKLLSAIIDANHDVFGAYFLESFEKLYFYMEDSDSLLIGRYKHLTFRFHDAINIYNDLIKSYPDIYAPSYSTFWDTINYRTPGVDTFMYFRAKAYWDMGDWNNCSLSYNEIIEKYPYTKWMRPIRLFLEDCDKHINI